MPRRTHIGRPHTVTSGPRIISSTPQPTTGQGRLPQQRKVSVPRGYLFLSCASPSMGIVVLLGPDPFVPTAGWGGYEVVDRALQVGMTIRKGVEPWQYTGSIMFDGYKNKMSQEDDLNSLLTCAHGDDKHGPGIISISGLPELNDWDWVIESLDFDADTQIRRNDMSKIRQQVGMTIRQYVHPDYLDSVDDAFKRPKGRTTVVVVKKGDTPHKLAVRHHCRWQDIRDANPTRKILKANQHLTPGIRIHIPQRESNDHKRNRSRTRGSRHSG